MLEDTPDSSENLAFSKSMRRRRKQTSPSQLPTATLSKLKDWVSDPSSSIVLAQGRGIRTSSLDFAIDFLDAIIDRNHPVIWALPGDNDRPQPNPSIIGILRSLISQLLELESEQVPNGANLIPLRQFQGHGGIQNWLQLLERCIDVFPRLFIIIDTSLIQCSLEDEYFTLSDFIERMSEIVDRRDKDGLKVVIASWRLDTTTLTDGTDAFKKPQFPTDMGRRAYKLMRQPRYRAIIRRRGQGGPKGFGFPGDKRA